MVLASCSVLSACSSGQPRVDASANLACSYGYLAGAAQVQDNAEAEYTALIDGFQAAKRSDDRLMREWVKDNAVVGTRTRKTREVADRAVLRLLQVCRAIAWHPESSASPGP